MCKFCVNSQNIKDDSFKCIRGSDHVNGDLDLHQIMSMQA